MRDVLMPPRLFEAVLEVDEAAASTVYWLTGGLAVVVAVFSVATFRRVFFNKVGKERKRDQSYKCF